MAFSWFRKHQKVMLSVVVVFAVIAFTFDFMLLRGGGGPGDAVVGTIDGEEIRSVQLGNYNATLQLAQRIIGGLNPLQRPGLDEWEFAALSRQADRYGVVVSDDEVTDFMQQVFSSFMQQFQRQPNARLDQQTYNRILTGLGISDKTAIEIVASYLRVLKLQSSVGSSAKVSLEEVYDRFRRTEQKVTLEYAELSVNALKGDLPKPTEEDLMAQFTSHKEVLPDESEDGFGYKQPKRVTFDYVQVAAADFEDKVVITDDEIKEHYESNKFRYEVVEPPKPVETKSEPEGKESNEEPTTEGNDKSDAKKDTETTPSAPSPAPEKTEAKPSAESKPKAESSKPKAESKPKEASKPAPESKPAPKTEPKAEAKPAPKTEPKSESESKPESNDPTEDQSSEEGCGLEPATDNGFVEVALAQDAEPAETKKAAEQKPKPEAKEAPAPKSAPEKQPDPVQAETVPVKKSTAEPEPKPAVKEEASKDAEKEETPSKATDEEEKTSDSKPEEKDDEKKEPETKYKPLDEVKEEIRKELTERKAAEMAEEKVESLKGEIPSSLEAIDAFDLQSLGKKHGLKAKGTKEIGWVSQKEAANLAGIGDAVDAKAARPGDDERFPAMLFGTPVRTELVVKNGDTHYLFWKTGEKEPYVPEFDEVKDQVEADIITMGARAAARSAIEEWQKAASEAADKSFVDSLKDKKYLKTATTLPSACFRADFRQGGGGMFGFQQVAVPAEMVPLGVVGFPFADDAFALREGEIKVTSNTDQSAFYIIRLKSREPVDRESFDSQKTFLQSQLLDEKRTAAMQTWRASIRDRVKEIKSEPTPEDEDLTDA